MAYAQKAVKYFEPEDYLLLENLAKNKHEYMDGVIYAWQGTTIRGMAGASLDHSRVCRNLTTYLQSVFSRHGCEAIATDLRVRPDRNSAYFYPDVSVRCGNQTPGTALEIDDACLIVEVLSATTEGFDRQDKFDRYKKMASLRSYVLVDPSVRTIEIFQRDQQWQVNTLDNIYDLGMFDLKLDPAVVFEGIGTSQQISAP